MDGEIFTPERRLKDWRRRILGTTSEPGDYNSLALAVSFWQRAVVSVLEAIESGDAVCCEPDGFYRLTEMLAAICDVGPASIDPTPLLDCYEVVSRLRCRQSSKFGAFTAIDKHWPETSQLETTFTRAMRVLTRLLHAWMALHDIDPEADGPSGYCRWRYRGRETDNEMQPKTHALASYLHKHLGRFVEYASLTEPNGLFPDSSYEAIRKQANNASNWFFDNEIPLTVRTKGDGMVMEFRKTEQ